ncbi:MAG TPA: asparaginase [Jatrophihabitans sp.]|uniref:asparaginase n=1 Tax=Jatrophihabitans sp. TaxID=1932789 RepID=UPI002F0CE2E8
MIRLRTGVPLIELERSGVVESVHTGHLVVLAPDGSVRFAAGDVSQPVFGRSSLKPLQAVGMLRAGVDFESSELALAASSHSGSPQHRQLIANQLHAAGLTEDDLECPPDLPVGEPERRAHLMAGLAESRLAMNCSGKHAGMLLACLRNDWPISGYLAPAHPLQQLLAATVTELTGEPIAATGVDGCGAPLFAISLTGLAGAFSRIATGQAELRRVAEAIRSHPDLLGGGGRGVTRLIQAVPGLIAKDGAEGVYAAALPDGGAVALKIDDGASRAAELAVVLGLRQLGVSGPALDELGAQPVLGGGRPVGRLRPVVG